MKTIIDPLQGQIISALRALFRKSFYVYAPRTIRLQHSFQQDFGLTDAELRELTNEVEQAVGLELATSSIRNINTVGDLVREFRSSQPITAFPSVGSSYSAFVG